jgi:hypothetical protein
MPGFWHTVRGLLRSLDEAPRLARDLGVPDTAAQGQSLRLLIRNLTPTQRHQLARHDYFEVIGGESGTYYRIRYGPTLNVERLDKNGRRQHMLCFAPKGYLPIGDIMLAQKIALELFEADAIKTANVSPCWELTDRMGPRRPPRRMCRRPPHSA